MSTVAPGPIRELRESVANALKPMGIETYDVLPDQVEAPAIAVGLPAIGPSATTSGVMVLTLRVTLVGERADFDNAQRRLDDLQWESWLLLRGIPNVWVTSAEPLPLEVAALSYPSVTFTIEAALPC